MLKECYKCHEEKGVSNYTRDSQKKDKLSIYCKECKKEINRIYNETHKVENSIRAKSWRSRNREYDLGRQKENYYKNKKARLAYRKKWQEKNRELVNKYSREYRERNLEERREYGIKYYYKNRDKILERLRVNKLKKK